MIQSLQVTGLHGRTDVDIAFNTDINIFTGKNGSAKTTVLKLLWYSISGNLERIFREMYLEHMKVVCDTFELEVRTEKSGHRVLVTFTATIGSETKTRKVPLGRLKGSSTDLDDLNRVIASASGSSIFFPTFRRIEGGFSIGTLRPEPYYVPGPSLQDAMRHLSSRLTVHNHHFVASTSTDDIVSLLTTRYADVSEKTNRLHQELSDYIQRTVAGQASDDSSSPPQTAEETLAEIQRRAQEVTVRREKLLQPFTVLSTLITDIFQHKGISIADAITLGQAKEAISSEQLSAGEKQMLSFLCYNAFAAKSVIFIDEPEISLHVDWQRTLFPTLLSQVSTNQFVVATHSPFIYAKYPDKELLVGTDRGDKDADSTADRQ